MNQGKLGVLGALLGLFAVPMLSSDAHAGLKYTSPVYVGGYYASGGIGYARNTATTNDYIGCQVYQYAASQSMYCSANNTSNQSTSCSSTSAGFIAAVRSMGMDSHIAFEGSAAGTCTYVFVQNYSWNQPKAL